MRHALAALALLLAAGCDHLVDHRPRAIFSPWEEGRTLIYEDPSRPMETRTQVRVKSLTTTPAGSMAVKTFSNFTMQIDATYRLHEGLVAERLDNGNEIMILPEGFPDKVSRWESRGAMNFVVGWAKVDLPGVKLPDPDAMGVWVEMVAPGGARQRTLWVPDFGEVQAMIWVRGHWLTVNRLVFQGFSDAPRLGGAK